MFSCQVASVAVCVGIFMLAQWAIGNLATPARATDRTRFKG